MKNGIGVISKLTHDASNIEKVAEAGFSLCQLCCWDVDLFNDETARNVLRKSEVCNVKVHSLWAGWPGPAKWNFTEGPATLGLVPAEYREIRINALKKAALFAKQLGLPAIATHAGFIPEYPGDPVFQEVVIAIREIAEFLKEMNMEFWFETGQETPITLLRLIENVGTGNLGINLDPANLILYGKGNPVDALDILGKYVRCVHAKDGCYPTDPMKLGFEVKVGTGMVHFPEFIRRLKKANYKGPFIIEREISGENQIKDILYTVEYLKRHLK